LRLYLDTSVIVPLFIDDLFSARAHRALTTRPLDIITGDFAAAEFASALAMRCRMKILTIDEARDAFADFDMWIAKMDSSETSSPDIRAAESILRRLDLDLRAPDAIHIALAQRLGAELATFDTRMAECAQALGAPVAAL
jgi:predicted nucleic acid-binding protein